MIAKTARVTQRAALNLIGELGVREVTGRTVSRLGYPAFRRWTNDHRAQERLRIDVELSHECFC
jgi:hypothetical protein